MKATLRNMYDHTGYPIGDVDLLQVEEYRKLLSTLNFYDNEYETGLAEISVQIDHEKECLDFVWDAPMLSDSD